MAEMRFRLATFAPVHQAELFCSTAYLTHTALPNAESMSCILQAGGSAEAREQYSPRRGGEADQLLRYQCLRLAHAAQFDVFRATPGVRGVGNHHDAGERPFLAVRQERLERRMAPRDKLPFLTVHPGLPKMAKGHAGGRVKSVGKGLPGPACL